MKLLKYSKHFSVYAAAFAATVTGLARVEMNIDLANNTQYSAYVLASGENFKLRPTESMHLFKLRPTESMHLAMGLDNQYVDGVFEKSLSLVVPMARTLEVYLDTNNSGAKLKCETVFSDTQTKDLAASLASNSNHSLHLRGVISSDGNDSCTFTLTAS